MAKYLSNRDKGSIEPPVTREIYWIYRDDTDWGLFNLVINNDITWPEKGRLVDLGR